MSIEQITTIVNQGVQAFKDGKKLDANPYVNNQEFHMHWMSGFHQAAMATEPASEAQAEQVEDTTETVQIETGTEQPETETAEVPQAEAKPAKASKSKE